MVVQRILEQINDCTIINYIKSKRQNSRITNANNVEMDELDLAQKLY